ncbi:serine/threonine-protein kinase [Ideonella livida]|uniref:Serine/threonine protein kinase n=1 Tax=Ideonella livida TaxID=2707176 RepID=A0A7C9TIG9_9BURK|nr:serine/threonine-protein kinase [Ideonella livida]NDY91281.1 serine/threonine protein kinase [Ideonella livida]
MTTVPPAASATPAPAEPARWRALFDQALALPPEARASFVAQATCDDATRAELVSLLAHYEEVTAGDGFLQADAAQLLAAAAAGQAATGSAADPHAMDEAPLGTLLGPWRVIGLLGRGGMGVVLEVERADGQFQGLAAVKLLRHGLDSAGVLTRFAQERQALARLDHPHIARLFDAGLGPQGQPYFVMERVSGRPLDQAVAGLGLTARLRLFLQLCDAVSHAHGRLLVHRDLKPRNVMVTDQGDIKLLDFGIAKALDPAPAAPGLTQEGLRPLTPFYASPEQVLGEPLTTATDQYSLGVLLYELLTGVRPTGRHATSAAQAARALLQDDPPPPSQVPDTPEPNWPARRKALRGDLDTVVLKALAKRPEDRYASVEALADDLRRHLAGFPVRALPVSPWTRAWKAARRQPLASASLALAALSLTGGLVASQWQARLAEERLAAFQRLTREVILGTGESMEFLPGGMALKMDLYAKTVDSLQALLPRLGEGDQADRARQDLLMMLVHLGEGHAEGYPNALNRNDKAEAFAQAALAQAALLPPARAAEPGNALFKLRADSLRADALLNAGQAEAAVSLLARATAEGERLLAQAPPSADALQLQGTLAGLHFAHALALDGNGLGVGRLPEAWAAYERAYTLNEAWRQQPALAAFVPALQAHSHPSRPTFEADARRTSAVILSSQAGWLSRSSRPREAIGYLERSIAFSRELIAKHPDQIHFRSDLAQTLLTLTRTHWAAQDPTAALAAVEECLAMTQRFMQEDPGNPRWQGDFDRRSYWKGKVLHHLGRRQEAAAPLQRALKYLQAQQARQPEAARAGQIEEVQALLRTAR